MDIALVSMLFFQGLLTTNNQGLFVEVTKPPYVAPDTRAAASSIPGSVRVAGKCSRCLALGLSSQLHSVPDVGMQCDMGHTVNAIYTHNCTNPSCSYKTLTR